MKKKRPAHEYVGHTCRPPAHHTCDSRSRLKVAAVISHWEVTSIITRRRLDTSWTKDHYKNPEQHWGSIKSSWLLGSAMGRRASSSPRWGTPPSLTGLHGLGSVSRSLSLPCVFPLLQKFAKWKEDYRQCSASDENPISPRMLLTWRSTGPKGTTRRI